ncbi:MAG: hypothetical protein ABSE73_12405 [Planctomycetota bacterium]
MIRKTVPALLFALAFSIPALSAEGVTIDPAKAAQLKRLEPLSAAKVDVYVEFGQLTPAQAALVKQCIGAGGKLNLPDSAIAAEPPRVRLQPAPVAPAAAASPYPADSGLSAEDRGRLTGLIQSFRHGDRPAVGNELRRFLPAANKLITESYPEPIDLPIKITLWEQVASAANPDAALGLFETHRAALELARPVLIPYAKDAGGALVRRRRSGESPVQRYFTSRELRNMILDTEDLIAHCSGPSAAIFLMGVYAERYGEGEAPMRDDGRDWRRMVEACGGDPKHFDDDDRKTWDSRLNAAERAVIAEHLIPYAGKSKGDRRRIARNGLTVCLGNLKHPDWDAGRGDWERWWDEHKNELR